MAGDKNKRSGNEPEPRPIIVKKIIVEGHGGHHGGAWKVAYADFVTAMMAFFLLMWLLGATTEKQRKGLADYFTPTMVMMKAGSAGANGLLGGDSIMAKENYPTTGGQGNMAITIPRDASGTKEEGGKMKKAADRQKFEKIKQQIEQRIAADKAMAKLRKNIRFTETREGLRIDLIDEADFAMFGMATDSLLPQARALITEVAKVLREMPNDIIVRGHTDGLPYASGRTMNNWLLSSARAEATRKALADAGLANNRFAKIEGVADRDPYVAGNLYDPRNRRMSIVLSWTRGTPQPAAVGHNDTAESDDEAGPDTEMRAAIKERDDPRRKAMQAAVAADMGKTALPAGAVLMNPSAKSGPPKPGH